MLQLIHIFDELSKPMEAEMNYIKKVALFLTFFFAITLLPLDSIGANNNGRIKGKLNGSCGPATVVISWSPHPNHISVRVFVTDINGNYDTGCILPCPYEFTVEATIRANSDCKVSPPQFIYLDTCCPEGFAEVDFECLCPEKKGKIIGTVFGDCNPAEIIIEQIDPPTLKKWYFNTDLMGHFDTTTYGDCVLSCPGTYIVTARKQGSKCKFSNPQTVNLKDCCPIEEVRVDFTCDCTSESNGRIFGKVSGNCGKIKINIKQNYPDYGNWEFITDENGNYESSSIDKCILPCPANFTVTASKEGDKCKISTPVTINLNNCCGFGSSEVNFTCDCISEMGKIVGRVSGSCGNTTITIEELYPEEKSWTFLTDTNGYYDSSINGECVLPCPGFYKVTATKPLSLCNISPPQTVNLTSCCPYGYQKVDFKCECPQPKGRFFGRVNSDFCLPAKITISRNYPGTGTWSFMTDSTGYYESSKEQNCILPCPGIYTIQASIPGSNCSFGPNKVVNLENCCPGESVQVDFYSQPSTAKGIIIGSVYGDCKAGVLITVEGVGSTHGSWEVFTDINGNFQTSSTAKCILTCPGKYLITASKEGSGCTFSSPQTIVITSCCGKGYGRANFTSTTNRPKGRITGQVTGICNPVKITVTGISPTQGVWNFYTDSSGKYDTLLDGTCALPCPGTYTVMASKQGSACIFSGKKTVTIDSCCPEGYTTADFTCDCSQVPKGQITGTVSGNCGQVEVSITGVSPTLGTWSLQTDENGKYNSSNSGNCVLPCPGNYIVSVKKPTSNCIISAQKSVSLSNCCPKEPLVVDFTCNCPPEPKTKIIGFVSGYVNPVTITIIHIDSSKSWNVQTGADGYYDSGCVLPCPGKFKVTAIKEGSSISFSPSYQNVEINKCCPNGYLRVDFERVYQNMLARVQSITKKTNKYIIYYLCNDPNPYEILPI